MPVGDIYQCRHVCFRTGQIALNILHYRVSAVANPEATPQIIATFMNTRYSAIYKAILSAQASWRGVGAKRIRPLPAGVEFFDVSTAGVGTVAGDMLPGQVCGMITNNTALAGRRNRGRVYLPFPGEADSGAAGSPVAGYITNASTVGSNMLATVVIPNGGGSSTLVPGIYHRADGTITDLVTGLTRNIWATQRRRGDYGRTNILPF